MDIRDMRRDFESSGLNRSDLADNPVVQFEHWYEQARNTQLPEPNAMSLATAGGDGMPDLRTVLLKYFDDAGFVFYTNYESRKARELDENPQAALLFPWVALSRQVIIQGRTEKVSRLDSLRYFASRPRGSQIGAWVSEQSKVIRSRELLEQKIAAAKRKFGKGEIPLPDFWGGIGWCPIASSSGRGAPTGCTTGLNT
ncbi:pyridoxamine 5'-phosphate oxidase [Marinobacter sp. X15-166B]|uniref:pyridoxamine 5'-phosphate oxidase n=1 Tax=Marinobacter sp. X15-166B TaxID=1897620 RepID=UPI000A74953F|nr:pyridoxamine 5'-phosphate oxidase [Marinobacter sp. X15-166B]